MRVDVDELRKRLDPEQYEVCVNKATEPPFSGLYHDCKDAGTYRCACCGEDLFVSDAKFDSGTGWPSFHQPISDERVLRATDTSCGMIRTEVTCKKCGSHLGHVFDDGPQHLRYCIHSASLDLKRGDGSEPEGRT